MAGGRLQRPVGTSSKFIALSAIIQWLPVTVPCMRSRSTLLAGAAIVLSASAFAQQAQAPQQTTTTTATQQPANAPTAEADTSAAQSVDEDYGDEEEIVVQGTRGLEQIIIVKS